MRLTRLPALAILAAAAGCANSLVPTAQNRVGQSVDQLIADAGPPAASAQLQDGRSSLRYSWSERGIYGVYQCDVVYVVGQDRVIQSQDVHGDGCRFPSIRKRVGL